MQIVKREVMKPVTEYEYIAEDGKKFTSALVCEDYENSLREEKVKQILGQMKKFNLSPPDADLDFEYHWYLVETPEQLAAIKDTYFYDKDASAHEFTPREYPVLVRVDVYSDTGTGAITDFDSILMEAESYLEELQELGNILDGEDQEEDA